MNDYRFNSLAHAVSDLRKLGIEIKQGPTPNTLIVPYFIWANSPGGDAMGYISTKVYLSHTNGGKGYLIDPKNKKEYYQNSWISHSTA